MRKYPLYAAAMAALGTAGVAQAAEPTTAELMEQIKALQAKVQAMEIKQQNQVTKADVDATVESVLRDADKQSQLMAMEGFTAGWSNGKFLLQSSDGNFVWHPWVQFQVRNTTSWRNDGKQPNNNDDIQNGFEIRRLKYGFDGNAFTPNLTYAFQWQVGRKDGVSTLEDAWVRYKFADQWAVRGGQFKDPFSHESLTSSKRFTSAERTYMNDQFSPADNYVQGAGLIYESQQLHGELAYHDGSNTASTIGNFSNQNQNFQDWSTNNADWGVAGRLEYLVMGDWKNYDQYTALNVKNDTLVVGAAFDYTEIGDTDALLHTVDATYQNPAGWALSAAYMGRYTKDFPAATGGGPQQDLYEWGMFVQASYLFNPQWEVFARYDYTNFDDDGFTASQLAAGLDDHVHEINAGVNYYMHGHAAKFTIDVGWLPNGAPFNDDGAGILVNADPEFYLRGQFQLLI
jgi:hypothetical protein